MLRLVCLVNNGRVIVVPVGPLVLWSVCKIVSAFLTAWRVHMDDLSTLWSIFKQTCCPFLT